MRLRGLIIFLLVFSILSACASPELPPTPQPMPTSTPLPPTLAPTPTSEKTFRIVGYAPEWIPVPTLLPYDKLTHINYAFAIPNADGSLKNILNPWKLSQLVELAHAQGVKVLISVGGWGWDLQFEQFAANPDTRSYFVSVMDQFVKDYNLDGVDIDWEYPGPEETSARNFVSLMQELEAMLHPQGKLLTAAVVALGDTGKYILPEVFDLVDFINIMAYDGPGPNHSSYDYAVAALDFWSAQGLPPEKTVLGVPFYARPSEATYRDLVANDPKAANLDEIDYNGVKVYYNGIPTMQEKTKLAMQRASGIMIWELTQDTNDDSSLLKAINLAAMGK